MILKDIIKTKDVKRLISFMEQRGYILNYINKENDYIVFVGGNFEDKGIIPLINGGCENQQQRKISFDFENSYLFIERYMRRGKFWSSKASNIFDNHNIFAYSDKYIKINLHNK